MLQANVGESTHKKFRKSSKNAFYEGQLDKNTTPTTEHPCNQNYEILDLSLKLGIKTDPLFTNKQERAGLKNYIKFRLAKCNKKDNELNAAAFNKNSGYSKYKI